MNALLNSLTETERELVRATEPERLAGLDEDTLVDLHDRVRRARNKHVKVYRRRAATLVAEVGGRGGAGPKNTRNRAKAEVFEDVLCRVSQRLADAARASAEALRAERLAEGRQTPDTALATAGTSITPPGLVSASRPLDRRPDFTGLHKGHASTQATGARRQGPPRRPMSRVGGRHFDPGQEHRCGKHS